MQKGKGIKKKDKSNAGTPGGSGTATPSTGEVEVQGLEVSGKLWEVEMDDTVIFPEGTFHYSFSDFLPPKGTGDRRESLMIFRWRTTIRYGFPELH